MLFSDGRESGRLISAVYEIPAAAPFSCLEPSRSRSERVEYPESLPLLPLCTAGAVASYSGGADAFTLDESSLAQAMDSRFRDGRDIVFSYIPLFGS